MYDELVACTAAAAAAAALLLILLLLWFLIQVSAVLTRDDSTPKEIAQAFEVVEIEIFKLLAYDPFLRFKRQETLLLGWALELPPLLLRCRHILLNASEQSFRLSLEGCEEALWQYYPSFLHWPPPCNILKAPPGESPLCTVLNCPPG